MTDKFNLFSFISIWVSLLLGLILETMPSPGMFAFIRPTWILLILIYWSMALPHKVSIGTAFIVGILWDLLLGSPLGVHAFSCSLVAFVIAAYFRVIRNLALWQQAAIVGALTVAHKFVVFGIENSVQHISFIPETLWGALINLMLWPWIYLLLRRIRRQLWIR